MGIFRFLLAALVVLFHFGGLGWIVGRIAVFAFYGISGFLIFQVLDRVYLSEPRGIPRFFCNRFVRLVPLYLVYTVLTLAMGWTSMRLPSSCQRSSNWRHPHRTHACTWRPRAIRFEPCSGSADSSPSTVVRRAS